MSENTAVKNIDKQGPLLMTIKKLSFGNERSVLDNTRRASRTDIIIWGVIGAVCFLIIYGIRPLIFTDDRWILNSYVEQDVIQHYSGWMAFRNSDWLYPLGRFNTMSGGVITYTDSIPWVAIFFKFIRGVLPETFQFFGLYISGAFILQGIAAGKLLKLFIDNRMAVIFGVVCFCFSPIMIERAFRHTALASHFLITFCLYFLFKSYYCKSMSLWYALIAVLAIGIHPYFLPIVYSIIGANILYLICYGKKVFIFDCIIALISLVLTVIAGYLIGALGSSSLGTDGYGYFSMNINALYNPISCGGIRWSNVLSVAPQILGNYDGFNYLGLGILFGLPISIAYFELNFKTYFKRYWGIIAVAIFMTLFAISNTVTYNDAVILEYPLPQKVFSFASIFRASSRMFYPVFYLIMLWVIVSLYKINKKKTLLFAVVVIIQLLDIAPAVKTKEKSFKNENITTAYENNQWYSDERLNRLGKTVTMICPLENIWNYQLAAWGLKNDIDINVQFASNHYSSEKDESLLFSDNEEKVINGIFEKESAFITARKDFVDELLCVKPNAYNIYNICDLYFIVDKDVDLGGETYYSDVKGCPISELMDDNWTNGVLNGTDNVLLFTYSRLKEELKDASFLIVNNNKYKVLSVEVFDNQWINVTIDNPEHHAVRFPMQVTFE